MTFADDFISKYRKKWCWTIWRTVWRTIKEQLIGQMNNWFHEWEIFLKIWIMTYLSRWGSTVPDNQLDITDTRPKQININLNTTRCGSGSVCFWASRIRILWIQIHLSSSKNGKKNLDSYCFVTSVWIFIFKKWCKCTFKKYGNKQKKLFCCRLEGHWRKKQDLNPLARGTDPWIRIRTKMSRIHNSDIRTKIGNTLSFPPWSWHTNKNWKYAFIPSLILIFNTTLIINIT